MGPVLRASWIDSKAADRDELPSDFADYIRALNAVEGTGQTVAYALNPGGEASQGLATHLKRIEVAGHTGPYLPDWLVLTEEPNPEGILDVEDKVAKLTASALGSNYEVVSRAAYHELKSVRGPESKGGRDGLPPALQFGTFSCETVDDEWDLTLWYDTYRMPAIETMPGAIGCRRYQCVAGPGKYAVLYEFVSAEARLENYEKPVESHSRETRTTRGRWRTTPSTRRGRRAWAWPFRWASPEPCPSRNANRQEADQGRKNAWPRSSAESGSHHRQERGISPPPTSRPSKPSTASSRPRCTRCSRPTSTSAACWTTSATSKRRRGERPTALVLTEWDSVRAAVAAEKEVRGLPAEREGDGRSIVNRSLFIKSSPVVGKHDAEYDTFGPNIQLGQFNMPDAESEFALAEWYEVHRLEPFTHLDGSIRASRLSGIAGPTKFGVIYEFTSFDAHQGFLHGIEARSHDKNDVMGGIVPLTIHSWLSPAWGQRVV